MLNHVSIGVRSLPAARRFYEAALTALGYQCLSEDASSLGYGKRSVSFWILQRDRPVTKEPKSGLHFCFDAPNRDSVLKFHAAGLRNGGTDNGQPGIREAYSPDYYAAFLEDPDGYRIEAYCKHAP
jgi:catechol 2,3-dioxygenase-like lactoylglutathione lyase family enzyme